MTHVPYKGSNQVLQDLIGGQIQLLISSMPVIIPHMKSGKLRVIAEFNFEHRRAFIEIVDWRGNLYK